MSGTSEVCLTGSPASLSLLDAVNGFQRESVGLMFKGSLQGLLLQSYSLNTLFPESTARQTAFNFRLTKIRVYFSKPLSVVITCKNMKNQNDLHENLLLN